MDSGKGGSGGMAKGASAVGGPAISLAVGNSYNISHLHVSSLPFVSPSGFHIRLLLGSQNGVGQALDGFSGFLSRAASKSDRREIEKNR